MKAYLLTDEKTATKLAKTDRCIAIGKQNKFTINKWFDSEAEMIAFNEQHNVNFQECISYLFPKNN